MRAILLFSVFLFSITTYAEMQIYTLPLKHQPPEDLITSLKPLIPADGYLTSHGNNIIVRTNPENLAELQLLLDELDQPLAALMISVRRGNDYNNSRDGTDDDGNDLNIDHFTNSNDGIGVNDCTNNYNDDDDAAAFRFTGHSLRTSEDQLSVRCIQMKF